MRPDLRAKYKTLLRQGLAHPELVDKIKPGAVFIVKDENVALPDERREGAPARSMHDTRRVIIVQSAALNAKANPNTVSVVPCSASGPGAACPWDLLLVDEEPFTKQRVVAYVSLQQPMLKSELLAYQGQISEAALLNLHRVALENLGLATSAPPVLPPRL